ncbi:hypothetical protein ACFXKC_54845 [Streptomyces sp. NPDC059340]|uniref:hypothetical protein n=1 Tax=Streptomyces sp. NPDC059340 TaxID=3346806 RepID=UPI0036A85090
MSDDDYWREAWTSPTSSPSWTRPSRRCCPGSRGGREAGIESGAPDGGGPLGHLVVPGAGFADAAGPMRARDLCERLDLAIMPKNIESTRHKLKRLVSLGVLTEPEPGLFAKHRPSNSAPPAHLPQADG